MASILSFDVGIRHLAYCKLADIRQPLEIGRVAEWNVIDLGPVESVTECASRLTRELEIRFADFCGDYVIIERQPKAKSIIMVAVQMLLCSYFTVLSVRGQVGRVCFANALAKLKMLHYPAEYHSSLKKLPKKEREKADRVRYAANKKYAVEATEKYLGERMKDEKNLAFLNRFTKKDDLCDSFLQAVAFVEQNRVTHCVHQGVAPPYVAATLVSCDPRSTIPTSIRMPNV